MDPRLLQCKQGNTNSEPIQTSDQPHLIPDLKAKPQVTASYPCALPHVPGTPPPELGSATSTPGHAHPTPPREQPHQLPAHPNPARLPTRASHTPTDRAVPASVSTASAPARAADAQPQERLTLQPLQLATACKPSAALPPSTNLTEQWTCSEAAPLLPSSVDARSNRPASRIVDSFLRFTLCKFELFYIYLIINHITLLPLNLYIKTKVYNPNNLYLFYSYFQNYILHLNPISKSAHFTTSQRSDTPKLKLLRLLVQHKSKFVSGCHTNQLTPKLVMHVPHLMSSEGKKSFHPPILFFEYG